ncbi:hypothetical protein LINPERPRIM_LOCUS39739 [Linum perenne]
MTWTGASSASTTEQLLMQNFLANNDQMLLIRDVGGVPYQHPKIEFVISDLNQMI